MPGSGKASRLLASLSPRLGLMRYCGQCGRAAWESVAMIIDTEASVTQAVLQAYSRTADPRTR